MGSYTASNAQQYAQTTDLYNVISQAALNHPSINTAAVQNAVLLRVSEEVDEALRDQYALPLTSWGPSVVDVVCQIAAFELVKLRGLNPEKDMELEKAADRARARIVLWAKGVLSPDVVGQDNPAPGGHSPSAQPSSYSPNRHTRGTRRR